MALSDLLVEQRQFFMPLQVNGMQIHFRQRYHFRVREGNYTKSRLTVQDFSFVFCCFRFSSKTVFWKNPDPARVMLRCLYMIPYPFMEIVLRSFSDINNLTLGTSEKIQTTLGPNPIAPYQKAGIFGISPIANSTPPTFVKGKFNMDLAEHVWHSGSQLPNLIKRFLNLHLF